MSDKIRMSDAFSLPLKVNAERDCIDEYTSVCRDSIGDYAFELPEDVDIHAVVHAINSYDAMQDQIAQLEQDKEELTDFIDSMILDLEAETGGAWRMALLGLLNKQQATPDD